jgi:hypothetical protein
LWTDREGIVFDWCEKGSDVRLGSGMAPQKSFFSNGATLNDVEADAEGYDTVRSEQEASAAGTAM